MFDLGWGELLVVGAVALVVLGPKELPNALRTITNLTKSARRLAGEFQSGINEIVREAELEDARKVAQSMTKGSISQAIEKAVDPTGEMKSSVSSLEKDVKQISPVGPIPPAPPMAAPVEPAAIAAPQSMEAAGDVAPAKEEAKA
jgi:sec-independent protein translocase protein TatB